VNSTSPTSLMGGVCHWLYDLVQKKAAFLSRAISPIVLSNSWI
jgi:hypothetical protein